MPAAVPNVESEVWNVDGGMRAGPPVHPATR